MKFKISFTLLMAIMSLYTISISGFANSIDKLNPPLPEQKLDINAELKYIYLSDQKDREFLFDSSKKYSSLMDVNDSIRLTRVIESLEKKSPLVYKLLSEEQINALVEESLQNLINIKKGVIEEMKNNPEKYKEK